jgi:hypothetical protein
LGAECGVQGVGCRVWRAGCWVSNVACGGVGYRVWRAGVLSVECSVQGCWALDGGCRVKSAGLGGGAEGLGFSVKCKGIRTQGLGFGV